MLCSHSNTAYTHHLHLFLQLQCIYFLLLFIITRFDFYSIRKIKTLNIIPQNLVFIVFCAPSCNVKSIEKAEGISLCFYKILCFTISFFIIMFRRHIMRSMKKGWMGNSIKLKHLRQKTAPCLFQKK